MGFLGDAWGFGKDLLGLGDEANPQSADKGSAENPNQAYIDRQSNQSSQEQLAAAKQARLNAQGIQNGQGGVINQLGSSAQGFKQTINDPNAPSVARTMLEQNNGAVSRNALGNAAGVGGANAFAARRQALDSASDSNKATAQNAAVQRAQEVQQAQQNLLTNQQAQGAIFGQQGAINANLLGTETGAGVALNNTASQGLRDKQQQEIDARNNQKKSRAALGSAILSTGASLLGL